MDEKNIFNIDMGEFQPPKIPARTIVTAVAALFVVILLFSSFYQVELEQVGVVLRFGKYVRQTEPGLHLKLPFIEEVLKVPVQRQLKQEFGFRTAEAGIRTRYAESRFIEESLMLTGDLNVAVVEWIVQYRVTDPEKYLFKVRNVTETFRNMNEAIMRQVIGDRTVTEVLTVGRQEIESDVQVSLQELCDQYETGIKIDQVVLQDVNPPDPVKPSWDEVNQAQQQRDRLINEARAEYNEVIPRARGEAEQAVLQAEGYAVDRTNRAEGEASRFKALYAEYRRAPEVTRKRLYLETMQRVLPRVGGKLFLDDSADGVVPIVPVETLKKLLDSTARGEVN
ncbi:MAG: FtsH protease activity modulator HflK [Acidobacteriota bacterium]|nr:MAG: FtsH protease activity modulator HflK [Acidobacteriota bacterium]